MIVWMSVWHHWRHDVEADTLRFAEQRHQDKRGKNRALQRNGNGQGAALHVALAHALFGVAVHQASA
jgi:hypothetical protein